PAHRRRRRRPLPHHDQEPSGGGPLRAPARPALLSRAADPVGRPPAGSLRVPAGRWTTVRGAGVSPRPRGRFRARRETPGRDATAPSGAGFLHLEGERVSKPGGPVDGRGGGVVTVVVTGASGLLGGALVRALRADGERVVRLVRRAPVRDDESFWNPTRDLVDPAAPEGARVVVHLAGAGIGDRRWTAAYKREIERSRLDGTRTLAEALAALDRRPEVLLSASGIHYYGDTGDRVVDESAPRGAGFLPDLVARWEAAAEPAARAGIRVVFLRTSQVLSGEGG